MSLSGLLLILLSTFLGQGTKGEASNTFHVLKKKYKNPQNKNQNKT